MIVFPIVLIVIGLYLAFFKPYLFVLYFGIIGSDMGAMGISSYLNQYLPYYSLIMQFILIIATTIAFLHYLKSSSSLKHKGWIKISCLFIITSILSILIYSILPAFSGSVFVRLAKCIGLYGPSVFMIWISYADILKKHKKYFFVYMLIQCGIAFVIVYGPSFGIDFLNKFNAALYMGNNSGYFYLDTYNSNVALLSNFLSAFVGDKNSVFVKCGQFHNANGLGFAAGTLLFLLINYIFYDKNVMKISKKIIFVVLMLLAFLLWCNAGTRGPIIGMIIAIIWNSISKIFTKEHTSRKNVCFSLLFIALSAFVIILASDSVISYFVGSGLQGSINSRIKLTQSFFDNINEYFFVGTAGNIDYLASLGIDPHFLPMRVCCMYGIIPSIFILLLVFIKPVRLALLSSDRTFYRIGCFIIVFLIGLTNNYAEPIIFWLLLAESILDYYESNIVKE